MRRISVPSFLILMLIAFSAVHAGPREYVHHDIKASVEPDSSMIDLVDSITVPGPVKQPVDFTVLSGLDVTMMTPGVRMTLAGRGESASDPGMDKDESGGSKVLVDRYSVDLGSGESGQTVFAVRIKGRIDFPIEDSGALYARGFSETPGIICSKGVYLAGSAHWVPDLGKGLLTFTLNVSLPEGWDAVSQGSRISHSLSKAGNISVWDSPEPMEEVYLIAGRFTEFSDKKGDTDVMAFLRTPDEGLAGRYIEATGQYLDMYSKLVGPYPFSKFALVENFWETGYGMPSFTLLGPTVIRLPFILHSSYPHELLHNWWGNSVYVDFSKGNWCEGLTAYLADHLIKEQRGQGAEYRRDALQKYTDYVDAGRDFPLSKFISRHDAATEAVGYGKSLMMFHMLRIKIGDAAFIEGIREFYKARKFKVSSFADLRTAFEHASGAGLGPFFQEWTSRTGAPEIGLDSASGKEEKEGYSLTLKLEQRQKGDPFSIDIPVAVSFEDSVSVFTLPMDKASAVSRTIWRGRPLYVRIDPGFDVFRKLHYEEIPPSLSKAFGAENVLVVMAGSEDPALKDAYSAVVSAWEKDPSNKVSVVSDSDIEKIPSHGAVWLMGWDNRFRGIVENMIDSSGGAVRSDSVLIETSRMPKQGNTFVVCARNPGDPSAVVVWMSIGDPGAAPGLLAKLPHYGKYSYLGFEGAEPSNVLKGQWKPAASPMESAVTYSGETARGGSMELPRREPLAMPAQVFSADRMMKDISFLASPELEGRAPGTEGIEKAADHIADAFRRAGLEPGGDGGSWFQEWTGQTGPGGRTGTLKNVVGVLPGSGEGSGKGSLVISAHYDHLGRGWPDVREGNKGKIHPGADDNASGIAVMLELARNLASGPHHLRSVVFVAFSGEESGLQGSRHFVKAYSKYPVSDCIGDINIDTVGRLNGRKVLVLDSSTAREWKFIFIGASYVTGVKSETPGGVPGSSDQASFINAGVPGVQIFSGPHEDYHTPRDTPDKIDPDGLVKVASLVREAAVYLADRAEPLSFAGKEGSSAAPHQGGTHPGAPSGRKVSTGCMPDFSYSGKGVRVGAVSSDSPAAKAGIVKGDIITKLGDTGISDLKGYAAALGGYKPGDEVSITVIRDGKEMTVRLVLTQR